jgi:hypothetical protein
MSDDTVAKKLVGLESKMKELLRRTEKLNKKAKKTDDIIDSLRKENRLLKKELSSVKRKILQEL